MDHFLTIVVKDWLRRHSSFTFSGRSRTVLMRWMMILLGIVVQFSGCAMSDSYEDQENPPSVLNHAILCPTWDCFLSLQHPRNLELPVDRKRRIYTPHLATTSSLHITEDVVTTRIYLCEKVFQFTDPIVEVESSLWMIVM